jgi:hypothetical protein
VQVAVHAWFVQKGLAGDVQSAPVSHSTHVSVEVSQTGFDGLETHWLELVHSTHAPDDEHAGFAAVHGNGVADPKSPLHPTQVLVAALQAGRVPVHAAALVAVHWTHAPLTHAGS